MAIYINVEKTITTILLKTLNQKVKSTKNRGINSTNITKNIFRSMCIRGAYSFVDNSSWENKIEPSEQVHLQNFV